MYTDWPPGVATVDTVSSVVFQCPLFTTFLLLLIRGHSVSIIDQMQIASTLDISIHSGGQIRLHAHYRSRADSYLVLHQHYCWCEGW